MSEMSCQLPRCQQCGLSASALFIDLSGIARCAACNHKAFGNIGFQATASTTSDDGEPITREWVVSEYGMSCVIITEKLRVYVRPSGRVDLNGFESPLPHIRTRGQLRQLLAALGWRGEERG